MSVLLSAEERDALRAQVLDHLSGIGDVWLAVQQRDYEMASHLGRDFCDELQFVMEDLGWGEGEHVEVELTTCPLVLKRAVRRISERVTAQQEVEREERAALDGAAAQTTLASEACQRVLAQLGN